MSYLRELRGTALPLSELKRGVNVHTTDERILPIDRIQEAPSHYGIFSNVGDLAKLDAALNTDRLLSDASRRAMWAPTELPGGRIFPYALGWEVWTFRGHRAQYHGGITGAEFLRPPDDSLAVVLLTNLGHGTRYGMSQNVAKMLIPALKRPALREVPIAEAELRRYTGLYSALSGHDGRIVFRLSDDGTVSGISAVAWDGGYQSDYRRTLEEDLRRGAKR